jgi:hypothetical protein
MTHSTTAGAPVTPAHDPLTERRRRARRTEILATLEQFGPNLQRLTGNGVRYIAEITRASVDEQHWLADYVAAHPEVWNARQPGHDEGFRIKHQRGTEALAAAREAARAGNPAAARDHLDDALAYQAITEDRWRRLHHLIDTGHLTAVTDKASGDQPATAAGPPA